MKILILQHESLTPPGTTLEWLNSQNISYEILIAPDLDAYPKVDTFDGLIICGGSMNVDQEFQLPWLKKEKEFIHLCIRQNIKIVGLCLGSQLLAEALGAKVQSMNKWEIGWFDVTTELDVIPAFHWHQFHFSIPENCERLASSQACREQGFRMKDRILAFQFHPEVDADWIHMNLVDWDSSLVGSVQNKDDILKNNPIALPRLKAWYFSQLQSFFKP